MSNETTALVPVSKINLPAWNSRVGAADKVDKAFIETIRPGLQSPIKVQVTKLDAKGNPESYVLLWGTRRFLAAQALGWTEIPAIVKPLEPQTAIVLLSRMRENVVENMARKDLSTFEQARAFAMLRAGIQEGNVQAGMSLKEVAATTGKSVSYISNLVTCYEKLDTSILKAWETEDPDANVNILRQIAMIEDKTAQVSAWTAHKTEVAANDQDDEEDEEDGDEETKRGPKAKKYTITVERYRAVVRALKAKKKDGLYLGVCKYLIGKTNKIEGLIEPDEE